MTGRKAFKSATTLEELNVVNDAQKAIFNAQNEESNGRLSRQRIAAYAVRWGEALVHIRDGSAVLDIGCGWPIDELLQTLLGRHRLNYHAADVDPNIIGSMKAYLADNGLPAANARLGPNTTLAFADAAFDAVFSSHCLEHSSDLTATMAEIRRVLRPDGTIFVAVPFGFDDSDEHLLYLDVEDWLHVLDLAGFDVVNYHLGKTYPIYGWDLCLVARRLPDGAQPAALREFMGGQVKAGKAMAAPGDAVFSYTGPVTKTDQHCIVQGDDAAFTLTAEGATDVLFLRHPWSGTVELMAGGRRKVVDLYSRIPFVGAVDVRDLDGPITGRVVARDRGKAAQAVVHGALLRQPQ